MSAVGTCPGCGAALPRSGWEGLCPRCVAKVGLGDVLAAPLPERGANDAVTPHKAVPFPAGTLLGEYEILEEIARGGMGIVYRARQSSLDRIVAVKMILAGANPKPEFLKRFRIEAETAASLRHPNIVSIYNIGEESGRPFFSMEFVPGCNLSELIQAGPLEPQRAAHYVQKVAAAIHFAHQRGILHRDLKPSNILVDELDEVRVMDFGLAKRLSTELDLTGTGQLLGSPQYVAPEQISNRRGEIGPHTDVYSLGAVLYHLLAGHPPFRGETMEQVLLEVIDLEPEPPLQVRRDRSKTATSRIWVNRSRLSDLDVICLKCLEKNPTHRYGSALEVAEELERFLAGAPIRARPRGAGERAWRWARKHSAPVVALLMAAITIGAVFFGLRNFKPVKEANVGEAALGFTFADNTFADSNWSLSVETRGLATQTAAQIPEGQPGPCREIITTLGGQSEATGFHLHHGAVYVPALRGPIIALNVSLLAAVQEGIDNPLLSVVVAQNGRRYLAPSRAIGYGGWTEGGARALTSADFSLQAGFERKADEHPDFSASGAPIQFGFAVGDNDPRGGHRGVVRLDNWSIQARGEAPGEFPIADGDFVPGDWSILTDTGGTSAKVAAVRLSSGGNPGACWRTTMTLSNGAALMASCFHAHALYDPAQRGALKTLSLFIEARQPVEAFGRTSNPTVTPAVAQDGRLFLLSQAEAVTHVTSGGGWLQLRFPGLASGDFRELRRWRQRGEFDLDANSHPDFSTNGGPLRLAFTIYLNTFYHTTDGAGFTAITDFDSFRLTVQPARVP